MAKIRSIGPLAFVWQTEDPFLFCVHHDDDYPPGNERLGPQGSLAGRSIGQDFELKDGFRMYHGDVVPGFPRHPHRGFETVTLARRGLIDHSDSLGARARFGRGDAQWMTAGRGIEHAEMFPLTSRTERNPVELFQIWLNLPAADKMVEPHFTMLWASQIPRVILTDAAGRESEVQLVAGALAGQRAPAPPPASWASRAEADVAIWPMRMQAGAELVVPAAASAETRRNLYFFAGDAVTIGDQKLAKHARVAVEADAPLTIRAESDAELLLLQGRPIGEQVAQYGPFVMNTPAQIEQAFADYRRTRFGEWSFDSDDPTHGPEPRRFAVHAGGRREEPPA